MSDVWTREHRAHVGRLIREEARRRGITQEALAEQVGTTTRSVRRATNGDQAIAPRLIVKIAAALDLPSGLVAPGNTMHAEIEAVRDRVKRLGGKMWMEHRGCDLYDVEYVKRDDVLSILDELLDLPTRPSTGTEP